VSVIIQDHKVTMITQVRFTAQAWDGDNAIELIPQGPSVWTPSDLPALLAPYWRDFGDAFEYERWFDDDPECPEWIKKHDGPFYVRVFAVRAFEPC